MKKLNLTIILTMLIVGSLLVGYTVYAASNASLTISNRITFKSEGVFYKAEGNVFILSTENFESYNNSIANLIAEEISVTNTFYTDNLSEINTDKIWEIPDGALRFTSELRYIVYAFKIENETLDKEINVKIIPPQPTNAENYFDVIENTVSEPIQLSKNSDGLVFLITKCKKIKNSFIFNNDFSIEISQIID